MPGWDHDSCQPGIMTHVPRPPHHHCVPLPSSQALKRNTERVVNGLLNVKRLLKLRRADDLPGLPEVGRGRGEGGDLPAVGREDGGGVRPAWAA